MRSCHIFKKWIHSNGSTGSVVWRQAFAGHDLESQKTDLCPETRSVFLEPEICCRSSSRQFLCWHLKFIYLYALNPFSKTVTQRKNRRPVDHVQMDEVLRVHGMRAILEQGKAVVESLATQIVSVLTMKSSCSSAGADPLLRSMSSCQMSFLFWTHRKTKYKTPPLPLSLSLVVSHPFFCWVSFQLKLQHD